MGRKIYETSGDIENETRILNALAQAWHPVIIEKLPRKYALDAFADFGEHKAFIEVKRRHALSTTFDTFMISLRKVVEGIQHATVAGAGFLLVVEWDDGIFYCDMSDALPVRVWFNGRKDRNDREDLEPQALIPIANFVKLPVDRTAQM